MAETSPIPGGLVIPGSKIVLYGEGGTGKTTSAATFLDAGITPFYLFTEQGREIVSKYPEDQVHWKYVARSKSTGFKQFVSDANFMEKADYEAMSRKKDVKKAKHAMLSAYCEALNDFTCDRTGEHFGPVDTWSTDRALIIDSITGLSDIIQYAIVGSAPVIAPGQWGAMQKTLHSLVKKLANDCDCWVVFICHVRKEFDEMAGRELHNISLPGQKLNEKFTIDMSEVIKTDIKNGDYCWVTDDMKIKSKTRLLPRKGKLPPTVVPLVEEWKKRGGTITPTETQSGE